MADMPGRRIEESVLENIVISNNVVDVGG